MSKKATLSNSAAMGISPINLDAELDAEMQRAMGDDHEGKKKQGSAEQRVAYCILAHYLALVAANNSPGPLAEAVTSMKARKPIQEIMLKRFAPGATKEKGTTDTGAQAKDDANARATLVKRSLLYAAIFYDANMELSAFDHDTGLYSVPVRVLLDKDEEPILGLASATTVPLDGRSYNVMHVEAELDSNGKPVLDANGKPKRKETGRRIQASCARLRAIHVIKGTRGAGGQTSQDKAKDKAKTGTVKATDFEVPALVKALKETLCQPKGDADGRVHADAFGANSEAVWKDLAVIAHWYNDVISKPDFIKPTTGPAKPAKAKALKAAA